MKRISAAEHIWRDSRWGAARRGGQAPVVSFQNVRFGIEYAANENASNRFDAIMQVVQHVPEPSVLIWLRKMHQLLRHDGVLVLATKHDDIDKYSISQVGGEGGVRRICCGRLQGPCCACPVLPPRALFLARMAASSLAHLSFLPLALLTPASGRCFAHVRRQHGASFPGVPFSRRVSPRERRAESRRKVPTSDASPAAPTTRLGVRRGPYS